ncbi:hypothetical protein TorRG33x02_201940 [Trema orientale]|uniref:Uncharacterized protein n=1 Tax=Trema orientale TaxID=63057 RepID=A0A2P5EEX4_TREOI|nr:hypothetical protein TorRG33x02_201940 [Trema orientale]
MKCKHCGQNGHNTRCCDPHHKPPKKTKVSAQAQPKRAPGMAKKKRTPRKKSQVGMKQQPSKRNAKQQSGAAGSSGAT